MPDLSPPPALQSSSEAITPHSPQDDDPECERISLDDFQQLGWIAWHMRAGTLSPTEALEIYERNWRHVEQGLLQPQERELIDRLVRTVGNGVLLV